MTIYVEIDEVDSKWLQSKAVHVCLFILDHFFLSKRLNADFAFSLILLQLKLSKTGSDNSLDSEN